MKTNDILERLWLFAAVAIVIAFICSQIWIGKNYDLQRKPDFKEFEKHLNSCVICNGPVTDQGPPALCEIGLELFKKALEVKQ